jgi:transposase
MQNKTKSYLGMDVSKDWFDLSLLIVTAQGKQPILTQRFDNTLSGLKLMGKWLKENKVTINEDTLLVIENTGIYHRLIWQYCTEHKLKLHIGNAAHIKWSMGIIRAKNDVADSKRLCLYCYKNADELQATPSLDPVLLQLKDLITARSRLIRQRNSIKVYLKGLKLSNDKATQVLLEQSHQAAIAGLETSLKAIETQIKHIINANAQIENNYQLLLTVPGIGHVTACYLICCTNNYAGNINGKQLASYAGVAPFANTSGSSIKGRNKVHKMANKDLKKLLHMGARSVITHHAEFSDYYKRKIQEGKHPLSVTNAIRNKIVLRVVAVIKNQQKYVDNYEIAA